MGKKSYTSESELESDLYQVFKEFIADTDTAFEEPTLQQTTESGKRSDLYIQSHIKESLVIEVKHPDNEDYLLAKKNIKQARDYAEEYGHSTFALTNGEDLFLFDYNNEIDISEIDSYYLNVREFALDELPEKVLGAVEELYDRGELPEQLDKDKIIGILRTFHHHTYPTYKKHIENLHGKDRQFRHQFEEWVEENGYTNLDEDEQIDTLAKQHTYALTNRLLFYKLLKDNNVGRKYDTILDDIDPSGSSSGLQRRVEQQFERVVENINYEPIFSIDDDIFNEIPRTKRTDEDFKQLLQNFKQFDLTEIDEDLIGQLYEELIPPSERKKLGQFYTPPSVAETIVKWTLGAESSGWDAPRVLDPACGSGTFPVEVYKEIDAKYDISHQEIINNISVVDINRFPLHLTGINLTSRNITEPTNHIDSFHGSFFDYPEPEQKGKYDAVVGNPPYISSKQLYPNVEHFREHLKQYNPDGNKVPEYYDGTKKFSKKTDAYIYFITNALRYLKEGGRLGVIIPSKWMETKYGRDFQQLLFDNTKIKGVVSFSSRAFEDALVNTSLLLIEKCSTERKRNNNVVDFIRVNKKLEPVDIVSAIEYEDDSVKNYQREEFEGYSVTSIQQEYLKTKDNLTHLYKAPEAVIDIIESEKLSDLSDYADIGCGHITGATSFFYFDEEQSEAVDDKFLTPAIKSIKDCSENKITFEERDSVKSILDLGWYVNMNNIESYQELVDNLSSDGFDKTVDYLEMGVSEGYDKRSSMKSRDIWCVMDNIKSFDIIHSQIFYENIFININKDNVPMDRAVQGIDFEKQFRKVGIPLVSSNIYKIILEFWGKTEGGGALQVQSYKMKSIPFPDLGRLTDSQKERLEKSYDNVLNDNYQGIADEVVLELLGMDDDLTVAELEKIQKALVKSRVDGVEPDVLIQKNEVNEEASVFEEHE